MHRIVLGLVLFPLQILPLAAQQAVATAPPALSYPTRIELKLAEGTGAVLVSGSLGSRNGTDLSTVRAALGRARIERLIPLPLETLDRWHRLAAASPNPGPAPGHLGLWFRVVGVDAASTAVTLDALRALPLVEHAYPEPVPELPGGKDLDPPTPLYTAGQGYAGPPPTGVNADVAHTLIGGRGLGVLVTDMESWWTIPHEDLCKLDDPNLFLGLPFSNSTTQGDHGTAVAGEIVGDRNGWGVRGLADAVTYRLSSWNDGGVAAAITRGINAASPGDVVLLEVHYNTTVGYLPAEYSLSNYNVILTGTKLGVHICEAAGNGNNDLNTVAVGGPSGYLDPQSTNFRESGAIMIGATDGSALSRAGFSNYGRRITANGWGYNVYTTGYGALFRPNNDTRQYYTNAFNGTSSASPIVTSVVACLVGAVKFQDEKVLGIQQVRDLLRKHGTPCTGEIQNRPDLGKMLGDLGLPDGLRQSKEQYGLGDTYVLDMTGPATDSMLLFVGPVVAKSDLGLNRKFHLDANTALPVGIYPLPTRLSFTVPNDPSLKDQTFYLQGIRADANLANLHVTSSCQAWVF